MKLAQFSSVSTVSRFTSSKPSSIAADAEEALLAIDHRCAFFADSSGLGRSIVSAAEDIAAARDGGALRSREAAVKPSREPQGEA